MSTIAVIKSGGKQYKVKEGDTLKVEKLPTEEGKKITFEEVLLVADSQTGEAQVGTPTVKGAKVEATVLEQGRDKKVKVVKYKNKTRYNVVRGHRQHFTKVKIEKVV